MTQEESNELLAESIRTTNLRLDTLSKENERLTSENEALKNPKKQDIKLATDEELDAVFGVISKPEDRAGKPQSEMDKTLDEVMKYL